MLLGIKGSYLEYKQLKIFFPDIHFVTVFLNSKFFFHRYLFKLTKLTFCLKTFVLENSLPIYNNRLYLNMNMFFT